jgi:hypothetical protein
MSPGEVREFNVSVTVPHDCCTLSLTLLATGLDGCSKAEVSDTATATCPVLFKPAISVTKQCQPDNIEQSLQPGDNMFNTGTVKNTGDVTLVGVTLVNNINGVPTTFLGPISLAPDQEVNYKTTFLIPPDLCGDNVIIATGHPLCDDTVTVSDSANTKCKILTMPMIMVEKICPTLPVSAGNVFTFSGRVINVGNVALTDITVVNDMPKSGTPVFSLATLAPGASAEFTGSYTLAEVCCEVVDVLTAKGKDRCTGKGVENTASAVCPVLHSPRIEVTKSCSGGLDSFSGIVKNTGEINLTNVVVRTVSGETTGSTLLGPIELGPGETASFSGTVANDGPVEATGNSVCQGIQVIARATCAGPEPVGPLSIDNVSVNGGQIALSWKAIPGRFYRVEGKSDTAEATWQPVPGEIQATGTTAEKTDVPADGSAGFYRVIQLE